jgi:glycerol-3-phosphate dehydrogenase
MRMAAAESALAARFSPDLPDIAAEAAFAADHEQAHSLADVLLRRTRLGLLDARRLCIPGAEGPRLAARAMGGQLGWDDTRVERELAGWHEVAEAEGLVPAALKEAA